jgi:predicted nucleic acid-binding protein
LIYVDTSALLRLAIPDDTTPAVERLMDPSVHLVSSVLLQIEARRGTLRRAPRRLPRVDQLLAQVDALAINDAVVETASRLPDLLLRPLDAIHLATALLIREDLEAVLTYDDRIAAAAAAHGLAVLSPA